MHIFHNLYFANVHLHVVALQHSTAVRSNPWLGQLGDSLTRAMIAFDKMVDAWRERRQNDANERALKKYVVEVVGCSPLLNTRNETHTTD